MRVLLYGAQSSELLPELSRHPVFEVVQDEPEVVVCFGGDGTLLTAERLWPGIPKVPIRNSLRGNRCIAHPAPDVLTHLASGSLVREQFMKLVCRLARRNEPGQEQQLLAMNEFNAHMARINTAVRFKLWVSDEEYNEGREILGDGFVVSTPFGSTAYFNHITRGVFHTGIGIAFKSTSEHTNHLVVSEDATVRILITRGPTVMAYDNSTEFLELLEGDELLIQRHPDAATILTWGVMLHPSDNF